MLSYRTAVQSELPGSGGPVLGCCIPVGCMERVLEVTWSCGHQGAEHLRGAVGSSQLETGILFACVLIQEGWQKVQQGSA